MSRVTYTLKGFYYFYNTTKRVITRANIFQLRILERIQGSIAQIEARMERRIGAAIMIRTSSDLYLEIICDREELAVIGYYFVNHANQTQFWLESTTTNTVGLTPVLSVEQLSKPPSNMTVSPSLMSFPRRASSGSSILETFRVLPQPHTAGTQSHDDVAKDSYVRTVW